MKTILSPVRVFQWFSRVIVSSFAVVTIMMLGYLVVPVTNAYAYNGSAAASYVAQYAINPNSGSYPVFGDDDCTNFVSQAVFNGGYSMEPKWNDPSSTRAWVDGFSNADPNGFYIDFGSADGCPQDNSSVPCDNGWTQDDVYYVSWGRNSSFALPDIYVSGQVNEWAMISLHGAQAYNLPIYFDGPLDEYDLDSSTYSPSDAWSQFWTALNNNSATAVNMPYSAEMHNEPT